MTSSLLASAYSGGSLLSAIVGGSMLFVLAIVVLIVVGSCKVYEKAGKPWWVAFIPFYNIWVLLEIVHAPRWWFALYFTPFLSALLPPATLLEVIFNLIPWIVTIVVCYKLSLAFGHGVGFAIGLILLSPIFMMILGFGKSEYSLSGSTGISGPPPVPPTPPPMSQNPVGMA